MHNKSVRGRAMMPVVRTEYDHVRSTAPEPIDLRCSRLSSSMLLSTMPPKALRLRPARARPWKQNVTTNNQASSESLSEHMWRHVGQCLRTKPPRGHVQVAWLQHTCSAGVH
jgi:hypothetical protein